MVPKVFTGVIATAIVLAVSQQCECHTLGDGRTTPACRNVSRFSFIENENTELCKRDECNDVIMTKMDAHEVIGRRGQQLSDNSTLSDLDAKESDVTPRSHFPHRCSVVKNSQEVTTAEQSRHAPSDSSHNRRCPTETVFVRCANQHHVDNTLLIDDSVRKRASVSHWIGADSPLNRNSLGLPLGTVGEAMSHVLVSMSKKHRGSCQLAESLQWRTLPLQYFFLILLCILAGTVTRGVVIQLNAASYGRRIVRTPLRVSALTKKDNSGSLSNCFGSARIPRKVTWRPLLPWLFATIIVALRLVSLRTVAGVSNATTDLRGQIIDGNEPCFYFDTEKSVFLMTCSVLDWQAQGYGPETHIALGSNEVFHGGIAGNVIDLEGIDGFQGLFTIMENVTSISEAPFIQNVHVKNGKTADDAGFIVQKSQANFVVDSCSSTGTISNDDSGGICGSNCGSNGEVSIYSSHSTGSITGKSAGGITGARAGSNSGLVNIIGCSSTGDIKGKYAGGICGTAAGRRHGEVHILHSYSTGNILPDAQYGGGIVGVVGAFINGYIQVEDCNSTGIISSTKSGGIAGARLGDTYGQVDIRNCHSEGHIFGQKAGGITGAFTANTGGIISIADASSKGTIMGVYAGGICGSDAGMRNGEVYITKSHSVGDISQSATSSGGIVGLAAAYSGGYVSIRDSYSKGQIFAGESGGISGSRIAHTEGLVDIVDCYAEGSISGATSGGILGEKAGFNGGIVSVTNCYSTGDIGGNNAGGIAGSEAGQQNGRVYISGSNSTGDVLSAAYLGGGIVGLAPGFSNGYAYIQNCSSSGAIFAVGGGGISGAGPGQKGGFVKIEDCSSLGDISGKRAGGIAGSHTAMDGGTVAITASHSWGAIKEKYGGGICGSDTGSTDGEVNITDCSSNGHIMSNAAYAGGIVGSASGVYQAHITIRQCFSKGKISAYAGGGIGGSHLAYHEGIVNILDSYTEGNISGQYAGGIAGDHAGDTNGTVNILDCYSKGYILGEASGGISGCNSGINDGQVHISRSYSMGSILESAKFSGGITGNAAGFKGGVVAIHQCHSNGTISAWGSGGISGGHSGHTNGVIKISDCHSRGKISGTYAGGISGAMSGYNSGMLNITNCYSTGEIAGQNCGGICGSDAAQKSGQVQITRSFSTGNIVDGYSGGITGNAAAARGGYVIVEQSFSTGEVAAYASGGIVGPSAGIKEGHVVIRDCYSRGDVSGTLAGGIAGAWSGGGIEDAAVGANGDISIINAYSSGLLGTISGGILGSIKSEYSGDFEVKYSVYNGEGNEKLVHVPSVDSIASIGNSNELKDIRGQLYHFDGAMVWNDSVWALNGTGELPILWFQRNKPDATPAPSPSASCTITPTVSGTPSATKSVTSSVTPTVSVTPSATKSVTSSVTPTVSGTTSVTRSVTSSSKPSVSSSETARVSPTPPRTTQSPGTSAPTTHTVRPSTSSSTSAATLSGSASFLRSRTPSPSGSISRSLEPEPSLADPPASNEGSDDFAMSTVVQTALGVVALIVCVFGLLSILHKRRQKTESIQVKDCVDAHGKPPNLVKHDLDSKPRAIKSRASFKHSASFKMHDNPLASDSQSDSEESGSAPATANDEAKRSFMSSLMRGGTKAVKPSSIVTKENEASGSEVSQAPAAARWKSPEAFSIRQSMVQFYDNPLHPNSKETSGDSQASTNDAVATREASLAADERRASMQFYDNPLGQPREALHGEPKAESVGRANDKDSQQREATAVAERLQLFNSKVSNQLPGRSMADPHLGSDKSNAAPHCSKPICPTGPEVSSSQLQVNVVTSASAGNVSVGELGRTPSNNSGTSTTSRNTNSSRPEEYLETDTAQRSSRQSGSKPGSKSASSGTANIIWDFANRRTSQLVGQPEEGSGKREWRPKKSRASRVRAMQASVRSSPNSKSLETVPNESTP